eukprot:CAMPEP_0113655926 /NCGR_PEP_ID=MMETSP0017_2-20120614/30012_1 /TAXON_ID=2856 /ORGANISM="Cylindrotheca closterium" /LENGTH=67 /DNA_ID=CAMNT_0000569297 /DNA_START=9 /DNA_END=208 /DNA_ORIENTATION=- /assembly_acc=CAM_ASM_000147
MTDILSNSSNGWADRSEKSQQSFIGNNANAETTSVVGSKSSETIDAVSMRENHSKPSLDLEVEILEG